MGLFSRQNLLRRPAAAIRTVLIVEDEPIVAFDNEHALTHAGYEVADTVDRYALALEAMAMAPVDLVIVDIMLHGEQAGLDVARHALGLHIPVLFSAATCPPEARALGMAWLAKPYHSRDLVRAIAVMETILAGGMPRALPEGMTLFPPAA